MISWLEGSIGDPKNHIKIIISYLDLCLKILNLIINNYRPTKTQAMS